MTDRFASVEAEALKLPTEERALLVEHLIASLGCDPDIEDAWAAEVANRLAEIEAGTASYVAADEAVAHARRSIQ